MSSRALARVAGLFYALNFILGIAALVWQRDALTGWANQALVAAAVDYAIVILLFACLFEAAGRSLSWSVAAIGLVGCGLSLLGPLDLFPSPVNALAVFGLYCLGLGALIVRSDMMPRTIGLVLMAGGVSWLTFASPSLAARLQPWNMAPGALAELVFTLWLLVFGVRSVDEAAPNAEESSSLAA